MCSLYLVRKSVISTSVYLSIAATKNAIVPLIVNMLREININQRLQGLVASLLLLVAALLAGVPAIADVLSFCQNPCCW
jgi:hypothetical protein